MPKEAISSASIASCRFLECKQLHLTHADIGYIEGRNAPNVGPYNADTFDHRPEYGRTNLSLCGETDNQETSAGAKIFDRLLVSRALDVSSVSDARRHEIKNLRRPLKRARHVDPLHPPLPECLSRGLSSHGNRPISPRQASGTALSFLRRCLEVVMLSKRKKKGKIT